MSKRNPEHIQHHDQSFSRPRRKIDNMERIEFNATPKENIAQNLRKRVIGQEDAVLALAEALVKIEANMSNPRLPLGVFLFLGPTGVGKTEMARALAEHWFNDAYSSDLLRIDMTDFSEPHTISRFVGSPPGYIGYNETPVIPHKWANSKSPKILLFDELEKAHPQVLQALLPIFSEGQLSARNPKTGHNEILHFSNVLIICTSNAGSSDMAEAREKRPLGFARARQNDDIDTIKKIGLEALKKHFAPELLGRLNPIVFQPLQKEYLGNILEKFLQETNAQSSLNGAPMIRMSREVRQYVIAHFEKRKESGGRALRQSFEELIVARAAEAFIAGAVPIDASIRFELEDGELQLYKKKEQPIKNTVFTTDLGDLTPEEFEKLEKLTRPKAKKKSKKIPPKKRKAYVVFFTEEDDDFELR